MTRTFKKGFTLIELLMTLTIIIVITTFSSPLFIKLFEKQKALSAIYDFYAAIHHARTSAIGRSTRITLVPGDGEHWESGWISFIDSVPNGQLDATEKILIKHTALPQGMHLESNIPRDQQMGNKIYFSYSASGFSQKIMGGAQSGTFKLNYKEHLLCMQISFLGKARISEAHEC